MVSGSISSTFYGRPRSTQDIDIIIEAKIENLQELVKILQNKKYYADEEAAAEALSHTSIFNVFDASSGYKADLIIRKDRPYSIEEFKRRRTVDVLGLSIHLVAPEDAILSKLEWAKKGQSERQFTTDALGVAIVQSDKLDFEYMQTWARILDIEDYLNRLIEESSKYR
ncbi:MAG: hypothetical protein V3T35_11965 [Spirochaetia bacterium]